MVKKEQFQEKSSPFLHTSNHSEKEKKKSNSLPKISFKIFYRHTKISIYILNNNGNLAVRQYRTKVSSFKKPSNSLKKENNQSLLHYTETKPIH